MRQQMPVRIPRIGGNVSVLLLHIVSLNYGLANVLPAKIAPIWGSGLGAMEHRKRPFFLWPFFWYIMHDARNHRVVHGETGRHVTAFKRT